MKIRQRKLQLQERKKGFHLITAEVVKSMPEIKEIEAGLCQVFIQHTSASLSINEGADPAVRKDFETFFSRLVPEDESAYAHNTEGGDDMPAHLKSSLLGSSVLIPIRNGRLALGPWQGIYVCEHRERAGARHLVVTVLGD